MTATDDIKIVVTHYRQERQPITAVWRNGGFSALYDNFVVGSSAVLRLNFSAKNPPPSQSRKTLEPKLKKHHTCPKRFEIVKKNEIGSGRIQYV